MKRRMRRAVRTETISGYHRAHEYPPMSKGLPPEHLKATYTVTPTTKGCEWEVDVQLGGWHNLGRFEMARRWHPGPNRYAGHAGDQAQAEVDAREVIDYVRSVHAELVATVQPPTTREVIL